MINKFLENFDGKIFKGTGDDMDVREILSSQKLSRFKLFFSGYDLVFIDEAQRIPDVGYALKLLVDHFPELVINHLGMAKQSIERYLDLLEKTFVIRRVGGFSRNLRKEITKTSRYYFWDNGVRNAVISNFNLPDIRNDMGMLWENFMVMERLKRNEYQRVFANYYFWRTYDRQEIDLVEERNGQLSGFEFKWTQRRVKPPKAWLDAYPDAGYLVVSRDNFLEFLVEGE